MLRNSIIPFYFIFSTAFIISTQSFTFAEDRKGLESHLSVGMGWEQLKYEEEEPNRSLGSSAKVSNVIMGIEALKRWKSVFSGINTIFPLIRGDDQEEWTTSATSYQTNTLEYGWMRIDGYIGYPSTYFFNPYGGMRLSESKQTRTEFLVNGTTVAGTAEENVRSWSLFLGVRGNGNLTPKWRWNYRIEYFVPIDVEVTNSAIPGFEASDKDGYAFDLKFEVEYSYTEALSFGFMMYGGRMHWDGSDWEPFAGGLVKWPENNTDHLGGALNIIWRFGKRVSK
jgi:hypothetical protein